MVTAAEPDRIESEETTHSEAAPPKPGGFAWWFHRIAPARLTSRILLLNLAGLALLVSGILYFNQFRQGLVDARIQSLMTQAHIIAAAIAGSASVDTGTIVIDPDTLAEADDTQADDEGQLDFPINPETSGPILRRLLSNTTIRARVIDPAGTLIVDSRFLYGRGEIMQQELPPLNAPEDAPFIARWWSRFADWVYGPGYPLQREYGPDNGMEFPEVVAALRGASVSVVRVNEAREIIVSAAVPVQRFRAVLGTLVLSTSGGEIDNVLWAERRVVLSTFGFTALVSLLLSTLLASTISEPLRRLAASADRVRKGINKRVEIPDFSQRRDEIGHLSGALRDMTGALYNRIDAIEAFAADVSHELKNPLTSLRSAVETFQFAKTDEQRGRLIDIVKDDVKRLDRLITDISDASRLDAELARAEAHPVDMVKLLDAIVSLANEMRKDGQPATNLDVADPPLAVDRDKAFTVVGHDTRLGQVIRNLTDNARSFSPADKAVRVRLRRLLNEVEIRVEDEGPGIPPDNLQRVFERFYTDRPEGSFGKNSGLGLSISKQIVEAHKGRIWAENRYGRAAQGEADRPVLGARFIIRLPAMPAGWKPPESR